MNYLAYIENTKKAINKYCKSKKYDFTFEDIIYYYKMFKSGEYLPANNMDVIYQFKNQLEYIDSLNL
jgi:hypothetical protein